jgi:intein/homing endonuclease
MRTITKNNKQALQPKLLEMLISNEEFEKNKFIYAITSEKQAKGKIIGLTSNRLKAKRLCFTKVKKVRKAYYTKVVYDYTVPKELIKALIDELKEDKPKRALKKARK